MKRGIKTGLVLVMAVSILGLGLIGCAKPAPAPALTPTPTPAPAPTPTPAPAPSPTPTPPKVYKLKFSTHHTPSHYIARAAVIPFVEAVEERSGGRIDIDMYWGGSLAKITVAVEALRTGVADIAPYTVAFFPAEFPLHQVHNLPPLNKTAYDFLKIYRGTYDEYLKPSLDKLGLVEIGTHSYVDFSLLTKGKPVSRIEDIKGMTIGVANVTAAQLVAQFGGIPLEVWSGDVYEALQKGIIEGRIDPSSVIVTWKSYEAAKPGYWADLRGRSFASGTLTFTMNKRVYDSLPADLRKIIDDAGWEFLSEAASRVNDSEKALAVKVMSEYGIKIITWDEAELKRLDAVLAQTWDEWAKKTDAKGLPGSKLVAAMRALAGK